MRKVANIVLAIGLISLILGIISRLTLIPIPIVPGTGIEANVFLKFTNTCLLLTIALILLEKK